MKFLKKALVALLLLPACLCLTGQGCPGYYETWQEIQASSRIVSWEYLPTADEGTFSYQRIFRIDYQITNNDEEPVEYFKTTVRIDYAGGCTEEWIHSHRLPCSGCPDFSDGGIYGYFHKDAILPGETFIYTMYPPTTDGGYHPANISFVGEDYWRYGCEGVEIVAVDIIDFYARSEF